MSVQFLALALACLAVIYFAKRKSLGVSIVWSKEGIGYSKFGKIREWTTWEMIESIRLTKSEAHVINQNEKTLWSIPIPYARKSFFEGSDLTNVGEHIPSGIRDPNLIKLEAEVNRCRRQKMAIWLALVSVLCLLIWISPIRTSPNFRYIELLIISIGLLSAGFSLLTAFMKSHSEAEEVNRESRFFDPAEDFSFLFSDDRPQRLEFVYKGTMNEDLRVLDLVISFALVGVGLLSLNFYFAFKYPGFLILSIVLGILMALGLVIAYYNLLRQAKKTLSLLKRDSNCHLAIENDQHYVLTEGKMLRVFNVETCGFIFVSVNGSTSYLKLHTDEGVFYFQPDYMRPIFKAE